MNIFIIHTYEKSMNNNNSIKYATNLDAYANIRHKCFIKVMFTYSSNQKCLSLVHDFNLYFYTQKLLR